MKSRFTLQLMVALLCVVFTPEVRAQLPNAWQIDDNSSLSGSFLSYYTNLTTAQFDAATNSGWQFAVTCRMVTSHGSANGAMYFLFGDGTHRYGFSLNLNSSGQLVATPLVGSPITLTPDASTATNYHTHVMIFDPATQQVTYDFDGTLLGTWSAQSINANKAEPNWGSSSSADQGEVNIHSLQFRVTGQGVVAAYDAGFDGNPANAPSPTSQGWSRRAGTVSIPEGDVSPDSVALPPLPNAWQINDDLNGSGLVEYQTNLTPAQVSTADTNGWHYKVVSRMVSAGSGAAQSMGFGNGTRRFCIFLSLNGSGQLTAQLQGDAANTTYTLTTAARGTNYHAHDLTYDPRTGKATYQVDGTLIASWPGQASMSQSNQVMWGANSSAGVGEMNYHSAEFDISGAGVIASYAAGFAGNPIEAPSPTNQAWTRYATGAALAEGPVSPDRVALQPVVRTLGPSDITPVSATLNAQLVPEDLDTAYWFEYGTTADYGDFTATNTVLGNVALTNVSATITGLSPGTAYYCRVVTAHGGLSASYAIFTTPFYVTTLPATGVTTNAATLNASINPFGLSQAYFWEYGTTTNYGNVTPTNLVPADVASTNASIGISDLSPGTTYHFRAVVVNSNGVDRGGDLSFSTAAFVLVSSLTDNGQATLRSAAALARTNAGSTVIQFDPALSGQTIVLTGGEIQLATTAVIDASSLSDGIAISGGQNSRIFEISPGAHVVLDSLTLRDGAAPGGNYPTNSGGGILNYGWLTLDNCTLQNCQASDGGGIVNEGGTLTVSNCLFTGNFAAVAGGGIFNDIGVLTMDNCTLSGNSVADSGYGGGGIQNGGTLKMNNSTLAGNSASDSYYGGGGIYNDYNGGLTINNSTLAGNSASNSYGGGIANAYGAMVILTNTLVAGNTAANEIDGAYSGANNLVGGNPLLAPLGNYGGATPTMPPLPGSPAIDNGNDSVTNFLATDQRGYSRFFGLHADIGAVESSNPPAAPIVATLPATSQTLTTATLNASVAPNGAVTTSYFEYGLTTAYGSVTGSSVLGSGAATISAALTGLSSATYYHCRVVATNSLGTTYGGDVVFHTVGVTIMVLNTNDSGPGSLRQAILDFVPGDSPIVTFTNTLSGQTILLTSGQIDLTNNVTIDGSALTQGIQINGNHNSRIFFVTNATVTLNSLAITDGDAPYFGGGVENYGTLTVNDSTVANNSASYAGGGIINWSTLTLNNSTVANNFAPGGGGGGIANVGTNLLNNVTLSGNSAPTGGGIYNDTAGDLALNNSTVANNSATNGNGGGIDNYSGTVRLANSIVSANTADASNNIAGSYSGVSNLVDTANIELAPLGHYGGPTRTMPPLHGSPAIDAGDDAVTSFLTTDQRGYPRKSGAHVDIGAAEAQFAPAYNQPVLMNPLWSAGGANSFQFTFTNIPDADFTVLATTNLALPLTDWFSIGNAAQNPPGQYFFSDSGASNYLQRFYRVVSP